jgi:hypothetical protein
VVPDLGFPTITIGLCRDGFLAILKNSLSINNPILTKVRITKRNIPVIIGLTHTPNVLPIVM